jgi:hypothetical protein
VGAQRRTVRAIGRWLRHPRRRVIPGGVLGSPKIRSPGARLPGCNKVCTETCLAYVDSVDHIVCPGALSALFCATDFLGRFVSTIVSELAVALRQLRESPRRGPQVVVEALTFQNSLRFSITLARVGQRPPSKDQGKCKKSGSGLPSIFEQDGQPASERT